MDRHDSQSSAYFLLFVGHHIPGPLTKSYVKHSNNRWCEKMLGYLGQFNEIHSGLRPRKVLQNCILTSGHFFDF